MPLAISSPSDNLGAELFSIFCKILFLRGYLLHWIGMSYLRGVLWHPWSHFSSPSPLTFVLNSFQYFLNFGMCFGTPEAFSPNVLQKTLCRERGELPDWKICLPRHTNVHWLQSALEYFSTLWGALQYPWSPFPHWGHFVAPLKPFYHQSCFAAHPKSFQLMSHIKAHLTSNGLCGAPETFSSIGAAVPHY